MRLMQVESDLIVLGSLAARRVDRGMSAISKVECGFASDRAPNIEMAHDLIAKPLTLWRIMRKE
jgi:hypothetical protein